MTQAKDDCRFCEMAASSQANPRWIADFEHSIAFVNSRLIFSGRSALITRTHYEDMLAIPEDEFSQINRELRTLAKAIQNAFQADRMNYSNFGNVVPHQHWHVIPRYENDLCWGGPPIQPPDIAKLSDQQCEEIANRIRSAL